jgi:hypothetical protein
METIDQHEELLEVSLGLSLLGNQPHDARRPKHLLRCGREPKVCRDPDQANPELVVEGDCRRPVCPVPPLEGDPDGPSRIGECRTQTIRVVS